VVADRGLDDRPFARSAATDVTVLSWNTLGDAPGAEVIAQLAIDVGAEIVSLPETTRATGVEIARLMEAGGRPMRSYTVAYDETSTSRSTTLLISVELGEYDVNEAATTTAVLPTIVAIPRSASRPTVVAVHTLAPIPPMMLAWQKDLEWVAAACSGDNVIIAGDFNATLDHFAGLPHTDGGTLGNCGDAALATHTAAAGTWPTALPMLLGSPIDHVLATPNWRVSGMRVVQLDDSYGSDHRPILVQLSPAD
jgi:endonuclease/exonuclease/phosphatase (EEP) superfamily protein YafD